jgi:PncC family amidohydrolase
MDQDALALARGVGDLLRRSGWRISTAESCTGGLIGHLLTEIEGSSAYYLGGLVAYDNAVKQAALGVSPDTLAAVGAVSERCAVEMAHGIRRLIGTEVSVATTGIAGPGGGTPEKPVGLVYVAVAWPQGVTCERHLFQGDRSANKWQTALRALELMRTTIIRNAVART